jgi:hypothetical protein
MSDSGLYDPRPSDPETAASLAEVALKTMDTALHLIQTAIRLDRGDKLTPAPGEWNRAPGGSYLAQREAMLALGNLELGKQKLQKALKGWTKNAEEGKSDGG